MGSGTTVSWQSWMHPLTFGKQFYHNYRCARFVLFILQHFVTPLRICYAVVIFLHIANYRYRMGDGDLAVHLCLLRAMTETSAKTEWGQWRSPGKLHRTEMRRSNEDLVTSIIIDSSISLLCLHSLSFCLTHKLSKGHTNTWMYNKFLHCNYILPFTFSYIV